MRASPDDVLGMMLFARVVESRSFSDAARSLGFSKSAVSARVSRLEKRLGIRLLHRTTRRLTLTADGLRLYERCARMTAAADEAAELAAGVSDVPRGTLRVHASAALAEAYLAEPIGQLVRQHADLRVDLRVGDRLPDLVAAGVDVAVVLARRLESSELVAKKLAAARVVTCASPTYLRRNGLPFRPQDLVHHFCLVHSVTQLDGEFQTDEGPVSIRAVARIAVDDHAFLRRAALDGQGIVMLPDVLVADLVADGRLVPVLEGFQSIELAVTALHPHGKHPPASVRAFVDQLGEWFRKGPWPLPKRRAPAVAAPSRRGHELPITPQDILRLENVANLYADVDPTGVAALRAALARGKATPVAKMPPTIVTMRSRVVCRAPRGAEHELTLVYPWDAGGQRISVLGETGIALLGAATRSRVPYNGQTVELVSVAYQPEAAGDHHL